MPCHHSFSSGCCSFFLRTPPHKGEYLPVHLSQDLTQREWARIAFSVVFRLCLHPICLSILIGGRCRSSFRFFDLCPLGPTASTLSLWENLFCRGFNKGFGLLPGAKRRHLPHMPASPAPPGCLPPVQSYRMSPTSPKKLPFSFLMRMSALQVCVGSSCCAPQDQPGECNTVRRPPTRIDRAGVTH